MALLLRDVVGLSYAEIADSLEITLATVKWRIYKAREEVQLALAREGITLRLATPWRSDRRSRLDPAQAPSASRSASASGRPAVDGSRAWVALDRRRRRGGTRPSPRSRSSRSQAARGSPSRGWPTEPGLSSHAPARELGVRPVGREAAARARSGAAPIASGTWLWPTRTSGVRRQLERGERGLAGEHVLPDRVARAAVIEAGAAAGSPRLERPARNSASSAVSVAAVQRRGDRGVGREVARRRASAERAEVVVAREADVRARLDQLRSSG